MTRAFWGTWWANHGLELPVHLWVMSPSRLQRIATKTFHLLTLLLILSPTCSAREPGKHYKAATLQVSSSHNLSRGRDALISIICITILPVAVISPLNYTAYLGQPAVGFHCSVANADSILWSINGTLLVDHTRGIETVTDLSFLQSNLTISSTIENNNSCIQCVAQRNGNFRLIPSDIATFHVQGQSVKLW